MGSRWYSALEVYHLPGWAEPSAESTAYLSDQADRVRCSGGRTRAQASSRACSKAARDSGLEGIIQPFRFQPGPVEVSVTLLRRGVN